MWLHRSVSFVLILILPLSLMGADFKAAMLYGNGDVRIDGKNVGNSAVLYAGETVRTAANSNATITSSGTIITLDQNSDLSLAANNFTVSRGHAVVNTRKGVAAQLANLAISPAADHAKFALLRANGTYEVAALSGSIAVSDGIHTMLLDAGSRIAKSDSQSTEEPAPPEPQSKRKKGVAAIPGWQLAAIGGGAGAAGYLIYRATRTDNQQDESQTRPR